MNKLIVVLIFFSGTLNCAFSQRSNHRTIRIKGSDTMLILVDRLAEEYMKQHSEVSIFTEGGGTASGIKALTRNKIDICTASRTIQPEEVRLLARNFNRIGMNTLVAKDALSVYVNPKNPLHDLTLKQLEAIFTGKIDNWKTVGGNNAAINVYIRPPNSGTFHFFRQHVLGGGDYSSKAKTKSTTMAIVKEVSRDINAIGYGGLAYGRDVTHCKINNIAPSEENVKNDRYPLIRYLYFYTIDTPRGSTKAFIDWVLRDGQKVVRDVGYIPLWYK
jgi:phosphate transport system substrate-binding protein